MNRIIFILAYMLLWEPGTFCQEHTAPRFPDPSCDDFQGGFLGPLNRENKVWNPSDVLASAKPARRPLPIDSSLFTKDNTQAAGRSTSEPQPQSKKPRQDHLYLVELSSANWHPLSRSEKFGLVKWDLQHWETHVSLALDASLSLAVNDRPFLGRGGYGFLRRYGFNIADDATYTFFGAFLFPTLFHEDPRYIPLDHGTKRARITYALSRVILTRNDDGSTELNKSLLLATIVSSAISTSYYSPVGGSIGAGVVFANAGIILASDAGFNLFREYWPNVSRKLKLNLWIRNLIRSGVRDSIRVY